MKPANIFEYVAARVIEHMRYRDAELETLNDIIQRSGIIKCSHCNLYCGSNQAEHCQVCDLWYCCGSNIICISTWNISGTNMCEKCIPDTCMNCASPAYIACISCRDAKCEYCYNARSVDGVWKCCQGRIGMPKIQTYTL